VHYTAAALLPRRLVVVGGGATGCIGILVWNRRGWWLLAESAWRLVVEGRVGILVWQRGGWWLLPESAAAGGG
jgi:hypothetical protein